MAKTTKKPIKSAAKKTTLTTSSKLDPRLLVVALIVAILGGFLVFRSLAATGDVVINTPNLSGGEPVYQSTSKGPVMIERKFSKPSSNYTSIYTPKIKLKVASGKTYYACVNHRFFGSSEVSPAGRTIRASITRFDSKGNYIDGTGNNFIATSGWYYSGASKYIPKGEWYIRLNASYSGSKTPPMAIRQLGLSTSSVCP